MKGSRRDFVFGAAAAGITTNLQVKAHARVAKPVSTKRSNILFILADDLRFDGIGYRNPQVRTPNLDKLAAGAARFRNHFVTTSICCTSRASIFSGTYGRRHGVWGFSDSLPEDLQINSYPAALKRSGYRTGFFGKYGVNSSLIRDGQYIGEVIPDAERSAFDESEAFDDYYAPGDERQEHHHNERMAVLAENFLDRCGEDQPFCLSLSFKAPHAKDDGDIYMGDFVAEPDMYAQYVRDIFTEDPTINDAAHQSRPNFIRNSEGRARFERRFSTRWLRQDSIRKYFALVSGIDRAVGRVVARLEQRSMLGNTIIIFTSDNGYFLGDYGLSDKWFGYEASIRVPLFIRLPRGRGIEVDATSLNIDLAPTLLALARLPVSRTMQGDDLTPLIYGNSPKHWRKDFLYEHFLTGFTEADARRIPVKIPSSEGVRNDRYTYLAYPQNGNFEELFDRITDPHELKNVAAACPEILRAMRQRKAELVARYT